MPLTGGASNKSGNNFESRWTIYCIVQVLSEESNYIWLEPPNTEGNGCEFVVGRDNIKEYHQVKRQHSYDNAWSISELIRKGIIKTFFEKINNNTENKFIFISSVSANALQELHENALCTHTYQNFSDNFLSQGKRRDNFHLLSNEWQSIFQNKLMRNSSKHLAELATYKALKQIEIRVFDERSLEELTNTKLNFILKDNIHNAYSKLLNYIFENIHRKLFAEEIWVYLESKGFQRSDISKNKSISYAVSQQNARYENRIKLCNNEFYIHRQEVHTTLGQLTSQKHQIKNIIISGQAGIGKSVIIKQLITQIKIFKIPFLAISLDQLESTELPDNIGIQLGINLSPTYALAGIAKGREAVLVIDQLDAISSVSGRNSDFFHCIKELLQQTENYSNIKVILGCRTFDLEKDPRLRELKEQQNTKVIESTLFSIEEISSVLVSFNMSTDDFTKEQLNILKLPLHLSLFIQSVKNNSIIIKHFHNSIDIFNAYWTYKTKLINNKLIGNQWIEVFDSLCKDITESQTLFVNKSLILDEFNEAISLMESESILISNDNKIGFFHESFFDYVFARRFVQKKLNLIEYLKEGEQYLFKRSPLRQILFYLKTIDKEDFISNSISILTNEKIRLHLKKCTIEVLLQLDYANENLWDFYLKIIKAKNSLLYHDILKILIVSKSWFYFLYNSNQLKEWLSEENDFKNISIRIIANQISHFPNECYLLLQPYINKSDIWDIKILEILSQSRLININNDLFSLFLEIIEKKLAEKTFELNFWSIIYWLPDNNPILAAKAIKVYLNWICKDLDYSKLSFNFLEKENDGSDIIKKVAKKSPTSFLENILPFFLTVIENSAKYSEDIFLIDPVWTFRSFNEDLYNCKDAILNGIENSLIFLAKKDSEDFLKFKTTLLYFKNYEVINFLLIRVYSFISPTLANEAVNFIIDNPKRLDCGWSTAGGGDFSIWAGWTFIEHISKYCSGEKLRELESAILSYYPAHELEKDKLYRKWRGHWQYQMLSAIDKSKLSTKVKYKIYEYRRKFGELKIEPPQPSRCYHGASPIPKKKACKMSNKQWLNAINKYNTDFRDNIINGRFIGGANELSSILEEQSKEQPIRFANLILHFNKDTHSAYFDAIIRGLSSTTLKKEVAFNIIRHLFKFKNKPSQRWIPSFITNYKEDEIPDDILNILLWHAINSEDPPDSKFKIEKCSKTDEVSHSMLNSAINCVRGRAVEAIGKLILETPYLLDFFKPYLNELVTDKIEYVRTTAGYILIGVFNCDKDLATDLFIKLSSCKNESIFATHFIEKFMHYAIKSHYKKIEPIITRMIESKYNNVRETASILNCLAYFYNHDLDLILNNCANNKDFYIRKGAVEVATANVFNLGYEKFSLEYLPCFFNDSSKKIRNIASKIFYNAKKHDLKNIGELINIFISSQAFDENIESLVHGLLNSYAEFNEETLMLCEKILFHIRNSDNQSKYRFQGKEISELILRIYRNSKIKKHQSKCLDLIDLLLSIDDFYGISEELEKYQR